MRRRFRAGTISFTFRGFKRDLKLSRDQLPPPHYPFFRTLVGFPLRFVLAIRRSSALSMDLYIPLEAPRSEDFDRLPRLAASAAPAAICCFLDFAGIPKCFAAETRTGFACRARSHAKAG